MKKLIPQSIKNIYHLFQAILANILYGFPSRKMKVIGVTGTNGKTTTVQMIMKILEEVNYKVAGASTINFKIGNEEWINKTKFTTLSSFQVQRFIKNAVKNKCHYLVLETSSHSLDQYRVWGIDYEIAVMTNVTREHLDYHETIEEYRKAKQKLFEKAKVAIVNLDMDRPEDFFKPNNIGKIGYTAENKNCDKEIEIVSAENIKLGDCSEFQVQNSQFYIYLPGKFNIENALAAICVGINEKISLKLMSLALEKIKNIPGRLEFVPNDRGLNVIIDYAVTPDSLQKLYELIREIKNLHKKKETKIISIFGSCGERDRGKRPIMGEVVSENCDFAIVTNEDSYGEDPQRIIDEVASGIKNKEEGKTFWKIFDRREAIKKALQMAKPGDYIVITGKGAEETMAVGKKRIPWNDKKVILEELEKI